VALTPNPLALIPQRKSTLFRSVPKSVGTCRAQNRALYKLYPQSCLFEQGAFPVVGTGVDPVTSDLLNLQK
jgi:hypothetical protein